MFDDTATYFYNPLSNFLQAQQSRDYVDKIIEESKASCDLCKAENFTVSRLLFQNRTAYLIYISESVMYIYGINQE